MVVAQLVDLIRSGRLLSFSEQMLLYCLAVHRVSNRRKASIQSTHNHAIMLDVFCRYGGMFVIGMAYRGTANNGAIQKLLHFAVSDVSDDVRRAAVLCLGFVLLGVPEQCPRIVSLLSQSYNPHVRYGAAMAVGICCSGTGRTTPHLLATCILLLTCNHDYIRCGPTSPHQHRSGSCCPMPDLLPCTAATAGPSTCITSLCHLLQPYRLTLLAFDSISKVSADVGTARFTPYTGHQHDLVSTWPVVASCNWYGSLLCMGS